MALLLGLCFLLRLNYSIAMFLVLVYTYLKLSYSQLRINAYNLLYLILLYLLPFSFAYILVRHNWNIYYLPVAVIPMLAFLIFKEPFVPFLLGMVVSFSTGAIAGNSYNLCLVFLIGSLSAILAVRKARRRMEIISAGFLVGALQAAGLFFLNHLSLIRPFDYLFIFLNGVVCGFLVLALLPVFEMLFQTVTDISLLELADFNHPLLQRLMQEAPGTYHHSLLVGNISDAAAVAVGANSLLVRVGGYYHDIGKLSKPEYFSENQIQGESKHDPLSPSMSKLVIMNHVKEGVELARKYRLNPRIIDFIQQHHGTGLVYYFYRRALENIEGDEEIKEEGFRYPGPRPKTKEIAIVLLADSVEAGVRSLRQPTPARIEELVHKIINNKFIDRQLDDCELTLRDLERISSVFVRVLSGIYHSRIEYPDAPIVENNHKKSPENNNPKSEKDNCPGA